MSGDVQPRKRKEKRRKKDDEDTGTPPPTLISPTDTPAENVTIHIYKESSTGGHWCARIIFFALLAVLVGLIGIIIFEHRGSTDVDTPIASSRWASIFEGWVDDSPSNHALYEQEERSEVSKEVEEEEVGHDEEESTKVEKEEDDGNIEQDTENDAGIGEEQEEEEEEEEIKEEEEGTKQQEGQSKEEQKEDEDIDEDVDEEENDDDAQQEFDATGILEEVDETNEDKDADGENDITDHLDIELDEFNTEIDDSAEEKHNDVSEEFPNIPGVNEIDDDSVEPLEEIEGEETEEENINDADSEPEEEEVEEESTSGVKELKDSHVEPQTRRSIQQTGMETNQMDSRQPKSGGKAYDFSNVSNIDDVIAYEENNSAESQVGN